MMNKCCSTSSDPGGGGYFPEGSAHESISNSGDSLHIFDALTNPFEDIWFCVEDSVHCDAVMLLVHYTDK